MISVVTSRLLQMIYLYIFLLDNYSVFSSLIIGENRDDALKLREIERNNFVLIIVLILAKCAICFVAIHYNLSSLIEVSRFPHIVPRNMCRHYLLIPACATQPKLLEFPPFPPCVSLFNDKERREHKKGPVAFSARGREESRCVHVRLGKSEVTALTHK